MQAQVVLGKVTSPAQHFAQLHQITRDHAHAGIEREHSLQLKGDPMVHWAALRTQDHRLANKILDDSFHAPIIEEIAYREPAAHLRDLKLRHHTAANVLKRAVVLIQKK